MSPPRFLLCLFVAVGATALAQVVEQNTIIESESLDMRSTDNETISIFTGHVAVSGTNMKLNCDRLEVVALRKPDAKATIGKIERFKSLLATGDVRIVQGDREAACGRAEVLPGENKITLSDKPVVVDHGLNWTWTGDNLELLAGERQVRGTNVRIIGPPVKDLGFDPAQKPALPVTAEPKNP